MVCSLYRCQPTVCSTSTSSNTINTAVRVPRDASLIAIRRENGDRVLSIVAWKWYVCYCIVYKKVSYYIVQYPVLRTAQSALQLTSLADLFNRAPSLVLWHTISHAAINARSMLVQTFTVVYIHSSISMNWIYREWKDLICTELLEDLSLPSPLKHSSGPKNQTKDIFMQPEHFPDHVSSFIFLQLTTNNTRCFIVPTAHTEQFKNSFCCKKKTIVDWNQLNESQVQAETI